MSIICHLLNFLDFVTSHKQCFLVGSIIFTRIMLC